MTKPKYAELCDVNRDQVNLLKSKGYVFFTECDEGGSYYNRGFSLVNRIGYIVLEHDVDGDYFEDISKVATWDDEFNNEVHELIQPLEDVCYPFLSRVYQGQYTYETIWTNKGLEEAKQIANIRFKGYRPPVYYENSEDALKAMYKHNNPINKTTKEAIDILNVLGYIVADRPLGGFAFIKKNKPTKYLVDKNDLRVKMEHVVNAFDDFCETLEDADKFYDAVAKVMKLTK